MFYLIFQKVTFQELSELHELVTRATQKMVDEGRAVVPPKAPVCKLRPNLADLTPQKRAILQKTCILQNDVTKRQLDAQKRSKFFCFVLAF